MWPKRLSRQFLLVSGIAAFFAILKNLVTIWQLPRAAQFERIQIFIWILGSLGVVVVVFLAGVVNYWIVSRRLRRLLEAMDELRQGQYPRLVAEGDDQVAELVRGFNQTVEELRVRDDKLKSFAGQQQTVVVKLSQTLEDEREKLQTVLQTIGEGVIVLDSESKVVMCNRRVSEVLGLPMDSVIGCDLAVLIEQVRHRLVDPESVERKVHDLKHDPARVDEIVLELDGPGGLAVRLFSTPMRGTDGKILGRIATSLDLNREREVERLKMEFLSTISHELRTPLTSIKGSLGLIRGGAAGAASADMRELLDIALTNADRLISLINDILDIFQLERGQMRMRMAPMSLPKSVERALEVVATQAEMRQVNLETALPDGLPSVRGDARRIEQVLVNLLANAIKFSSEQSRVIVSARATGERVEVSVQDFGRGMAPDFRARLFSAFEHAQGALTRESQGAGLGLAICRRIVEAHSGEIRVESEEGKGSTFYVTLQAVDEEAVATAPAVKSSGTRSPAVGAGLILVVDDDEDVTRVISYVFESQGHRVIVAHNGKEAIELARRYRPDMLTLDLVMPQTDGVDVIRTLRGSPETHHIPIICISVQPDASNALALGADYYLEKPLDLERLRDISNRALSESRGGGPG